ncbi:MAG: hypothetical protein A3A31_01375 [Candidatus Zambryskibacteria bacterium RIFCSPLOWO2_01_FULL_48_25]|uniref:DUF5672 domain-containing protein n=1 Tax=Candidatus Zambryskibacteria bacterium RIFCSPHIGHO2_01_FULL_46_25 TaxID=1802738 RepID=A0A1G2SZH4_9BACT|nr:MAG: hypothetical protein A2838_02240 [Candidatus Zambryskibacteria bacterium RIFCSPHIGHO2_01_FULL_46_25]OHB06932.1 MAG: hypothetical protein A3A31_01375 [Candidatus Zambryskibacteria bacterium RIFCSPLOWO2_01_FULL_48_25]
MKLKLDKVTLLGIDCVDPAKLQEVMNLCEEKITFAKSKLLTSKDVEDHRLIKIKEIASHEQYSQFCLSDLKDYVDTEFVLLVQWDGFILNPNSWTNEFLNYDYIGAPWVVKDWSINDFGFPENWRGRRVVGNGGFCIRSRKFLEVSAELFKSSEIPYFHPEDIAFSVWYRDLFIKRGIEFADVELARRFAFEGGDDNYKDQFGFHGYYTNIDKWLIERPDQRKIFEMYSKYNNTKRKQWKPKHFPKIK